MFTNTGNVFNRNGDWWRAGVLILLFSSPAFGQAEDISFTFTRVVDTNTGLPGGTGNFIAFTDPFTTTSLDGRPAASIENGIVVFSGSGASGQRGIYAGPVGGPITTIADTHTRLPDGAGNFRLFGTPSLSQSNVAFPGAGVIGPIAQGAFVAPVGGPIVTVADRNTSVPGGTGIFRGIGRVVLDDGNVAFGHSSVGRDRVFVADNLNQLTLVADSADFGTFNGLSFNSGIVAFIAEQMSIFAAQVGHSPTLIVNVSPGLTGFNPSIDNGNIAFASSPSNSNLTGIYVAELQGGAIIPVALVGTPIPGGTGNFTFFDFDGPSQRDAIVAFRGFGLSGQEGIYASSGSVLTKVIDLSDSLDGKTLVHVFIGYEAVSGNQIAFAAQFADGSRGIYVAQVVQEPSTVVIDGCDSEVPNKLLSSGRTISDLIAVCAESARNHGQFVSCVSHLTSDFMKTETITGQQKGAIQSCAAKAHVP